MRLTSIFPTNPLFGVLDFKAPEQFRYNNIDEHSVSNLKNNPTYWSENRSLWKTQYRKKISQIQNLVKKALLLTFYEVNTKIFLTMIQN